MLTKLKNWMQKRREDKKKAKEAEEAKRYPNPFIGFNPEPVKQKNTENAYTSGSVFDTGGSSFSYASSTDSGGEVESGSRITNIDDTPTVYSDSDRSSYTSDSSSSSSYDSSSSSSFDSGSSSSSGGDW